MPQTETNDGGPREKKRKRKPRYREPRIGDDPRNRAALAAALRKTGATIPGLYEPVKKTGGNGDKNSEPGNRFGGNNQRQNEGGPMAAQTQETKNRKPAVSDDEGTEEEIEFSAITEHAKHKAVDESVGFVFFIAKLGAGAVAVVKGAKMVIDHKAKADASAMTLPELPPGTGDETLG